MSSNTIAYRVFGKNTPNPGFAKKIGELTKYTS